MLLHMIPFYNISVNVILCALKNQSIYHLLSQSSFTITDLPTGTGSLVKWTCCNFCLWTLYTRMSSIYPVSNGCPPPSGNNTSGNCISELGIPCLLFQGPYLCPEAWQNKSLACPAFRCNRDKSLLIRLHRSSFDNAARQQVFGLGMVPMVTLRRNKRSYYVVRTSRSHHFHAMHIFRNQLLFFPCIFCLHTGKCPCQ